MAPSDYLSGTCTDFELEDCTGSSLDSLKLRIDSSSTGNVKYKSDDFRKSACINACDVISTEFTIQCVKIDFESDGGSMSHQYQGTNSITIISRSTYAKIEDYNGSTWTYELMDVTGISTYAGTKIAIDSATGDLTVTLDSVYIENYSIRISCTIDTVTVQKISVLQSGIGKYTIDTFS